MYVLRTAVESPDVTVKNNPQRNRDVSKSIGEEESINMKLRLPIPLFSLFFALSRQQQKQRKRTTKKEWFNLEYLQR